MGSVFKPTYTKPLPDGAECYSRKGKRYAKWYDAKGAKRTGQVTQDENGEPRVLIEAGTWVAKFRGADGRTVKRTTGCRDKSAAQSRLAEWEADEERVKAGVVTPTERKAAGWQGVPLEEHAEAYAAHLESRGATARHIRERRAQLKRVFKECGFARLADLDRTAFEKWTVAVRRDGMGARNFNVHRSALLAFCNWAVQAGRLMVNVFAGVPPANEKADRRHERRAFTEEELTKLLQAESWSARYGMRCTR